jgi:hypothetical protein
MVVAISALAELLWRRWIGERKLLEPAQGPDGEQHPTSWMDLPETRPDRRIEQTGLKKQVR